MAALILPHFTTSFITLSSNTRLLHRRRERTRFLVSAPTFSARRRSSPVCCASSRRPRAGRKVLSNVELCNEIKEFLSAAGLPEDHVPSTKELAHYGRNNLANIVRRRGYKLIRQLLSNSVEMNADGSDVQESSAVKQAEASGSGQVEQLQGQDVKAEILAEQTTLTDEAHMEEHLAVSPDVDPNVTFGDDGYTNQEPSYNLHSEERDSLLNGEGFVDDIISLTTGGIAEEISSDLDRNSEPDLNTTEHVPVKTSNNLDSETEASSIFMGQVEDSVSNSENECSPTGASSVKESNGYSEFDSMANADISSELPGTSTSEASSSFIAQVEESDYNSANVSSTTDTSYNSEFESVANAGTSTELSSTLEGSSTFMGHVKESDYNGENVCSPTDASNGKEYPYNSESDPMENTVISSELPRTSTLEEKVARFMKDGYLDPVEDNLSGIYDEIAKDEPGGLGSAELADSENKIEIRQKNQSEVQPADGYGSTNDTITLHESTSHPDSSPAKLDYPPGDNHSSGEGLLDAHMGKIVDTETSKVENQAEISQLKYMLHQKELELSRLKEEIEKEKLALTLLQTKAETEIGKARKLISEKDAELQAAEESLSGLKEVEIQYCGDGDIVEVAGSFNGWHHRIKMDPQPLASSTNGAGSRKSRLWSTMLWLYPGVYEIKFVVDGQWKVDPEKESTTKGSISNNVLRVDR